MRFGLVGTGFWARVTHAAGLQQHPDAEVAGIWGRSPQKAAALADDLGVPAFDDLDAMLDVVDAVAFAVPPDAQAEFAVRAAERGRHLLLDKPLALDLAAADRVVRAVEESAVRATVFFTNRYVPEVDEWLGGLPGDDWFAGRVRILGNIFEPGSPYADSGWRQERGALWDVLPHALSIALPILGSAERIVAQRGPGDATDVGITHASGATSLLSVSLTAPPGARGSEWRFYRADGEVAMPQPDPPASTTLVHCVDDLLASVRDAREPRCDVRFAREVVRIIEAAERALA